MDYLVTAGYVTVETAVSGGRARIDIPRGAILPDDVPDEQRQALLARGDIAPSNEDVVPPDPIGPYAGPIEPPPPPADADPFLVLSPGMSVTATEAWVKEGRERAVERAKVALAAETAPDGFERSTLVDRLGKLIATFE